MQDKTPDRILVCGGRDFQDWPMLERILDAFRAINGDFIVIHGDAEGADRLAGKWARLRGLPEVRVPANWDRHGKKAGYLRNLTMMHLDPHGVIAFPGGAGTKMMADMAEEANIPTSRIRRRGQH